MPVLTPGRLFANPPLFSSPPADLRFSPDGRWITYRASSDADREQFDLYRVSVEGDAGAEPWLRATDLGAASADVTALTAEERAERERRRDFSFGVTAYAWRPDGDALLLPVNGCAYLVGAQDEGRALRAAYERSGRQSGFKFSPTSTHLSFVESRDLYVATLHDGSVVRITDDATETVSNGLADFLAAEEMHRFDGHWWAPDGQALVYCKVDEGPVAVSHRLELDADGARTVPQRYPFAGAVNPTVSLWRYELASGTNRCLWQSQPGDDYLARVHFCGRELLVQVQNRRQNRWSLQRFAGFEDGVPAWTPLYEREAATWINLNDDFAVLAPAACLISVEDGDRRQLVRVDFSADTVQLDDIPGPGYVNRLLGVSDGAAAWVTGWDTDPTENHLFRVALDGSGWTQVTQGRGWHDVVMHAASQRFIDHWSAPETPPRIEVRDASGTVLKTLHADTVDTSHPYYPYLTTHQTGAFGVVSAADGQALHYRLTPPVDQQHPAPVIVYVYGGPGAQKVRRHYAPLLLQLFAGAGFGVLELDNRGSGNRGERFEAPLHRRMGTVEVDDQVAALTVLEDVAWADRGRVGVFGHSYGGYMTLMCMTQAAPHFQAGVAVAPVCDWRLYDTHYTERYMDLPASNEAGYVHGNVLTHLHKLEGPLLLMHGMADDNVLFTNSTMIMGELQRLGKPFELMTYPGAKHSMQEPHVSVHRFEMILDFFTRHLAPKRGGA